jgi:hypothetical protein
MSLMGSDIEVEIPVSRNCEDDEDSDDFDGDNDEEGGNGGTNGAALARTVAWRLAPGGAVKDAAEWNALVVDALVVGVHGAGAAFLGVHFGGAPVAATLRIGSSAGDAGAGESKSDAALRDGAANVAAGRPALDICEVRLFARDDADGAVVAVATFTQPLPGGPLSFDAADALLGAFPGGVARRTLVLDAFPAANYRPAKGRPALHPPFVRVLRSSAEKSVGGSPAVKRASVYDAPNLVCGLGARLLAWCEAHGAAARWVGTAIGFEPRASCLEPLLPPVAEWAQHAAPWVGAGAGAGEGEGVGVGGRGGGWPWDQGTRGTAETGELPLAKRYEQALRRLAGGHKQMFL